MGDETLVRRWAITALYWVAALAVTLVLFYALDQGVMAMQGLPLRWDLSPAQ